MAEVLGVASSVIAVIDLSAKVLSLCFQYSREMKNAKDDIERLRKEVAAFQATTEELESLVEGPRGKELKASRRLVYAIEDGHLTLGKLAQQLQPSTGRKTMSRLGLRALKWPFESGNIEGTIQNLARCRDNVSLALSIDGVATLQNVDHKITLDTLPIAEGAAFDSHAEQHNPTCLPNTREELLKEIDRWIVDPNSKIIFWLNGMAGTGKSTISRTVAWSRSKQGDLGASFFFKRGETDRGNLAKFVPTMARQLAWSMPGIAPFIKNAVDADPTIVSKVVREQFEKLVCEPLSKAAATSSPRSSVVIVVDALDECESDADIKLLLELFSSVHLADSLRVRVLITSRPELPVRLGFSSIDGTYRDLILHKIPQSIIEHDIAIFLRHELANIRNSFNALAEEELKLPVHWPGEPNLEKLTRAAVPLFIFAATICRFVNDSCLGNPDELLQNVLHHIGNNHASKLDMTYSPVLEQQVINRLGRERCDIVKNFRLIVGTIITLVSPLSMRALALLLDVHVNKVATRLRVLHSVLEIPEGLDSPVRLLHLSFRDYLVDPEHRETVEFWVDEQLAHRNLAKHCLRVMRSLLRENICGLSFPGMRRFAVGVRQLEEHMPSQLQYACMYWVHHQMKGDSEHNDGDEVHDFLTTHFLHWVEVLSLLGRARECLDSLKAIADWLVERRDSRLWKFVADAIRFLQANFSKVIETPLQTYSSALIFAPSKSIVRNTFENNIPRWITVWPKVQENWNACLSTLEGHSNCVSSVAFSHDSTKLASADWDNTVRIWSAETGNCERVLEGHSGGWVRSMVFSHDSTKLASAWDDKTIRIWNAETGNCERVLKGHNRSVRSVVFSHDSTKLASGSEDKTVRIWSAETGDYERVLEGHSRWVRSVAFSHDSTKLASASDDETVRIWNPQTGDCGQVLEGHSGMVLSLVFSHDSTKVASASYDKTIRIWNAKIGRCERVLEGHSGMVLSLVFSHDSTKVASASYDKTIRIWNAETGNYERVLKGHIGPVSSVVFSHDSTKLASASDDKTVRIWSAETGGCERVLEGHSDRVSSVVFSHDSTKLASASDDNTVRTWNADKGDCVQGRESHSGLINSMVFSNDSTKLASASNDMTVRIWNTQTGDCMQVLEGHSDWVNSVVFSHDSTKLASASYDNTIRIWNTQIGHCERVLEGHSRSVNLVVFSHDSTKLASASDDETIRIWNAETGNCERVLEGHSDWASSLVFSHDSTKLASASYDKTVRIWSVETGNCERVLEGHSDWVRSVVFSHDSTKLASASKDETVRIWSAETGHCERVLEGHSHWVRSVVFSNDSTKLASTSTDRTVRIWNVETGICKDVVLLDVIADALSFTPDERGIVTDHGVFALTGGSRLSTEPAMLLQPSGASSLASHDGTWVTTAGTDSIWLPAECRDGRVAVAGSTVAVGCLSGRVVLLGFSAVDIAVIAQLSVEFWWNFKSS